MRKLKYIENEVENEGFLSNHNVKKQIKNKRKYL